MVKLYFVHIYCHVISCMLVWQGVRCGIAEASDSVDCGV